jgi:membrane protein
VQTSSALVGGISAAVLWGVAGEVFAKFVAQSANYSAIYSSFAVLIMFLLWLYVGWLIVLIGAQFSYFQQHPAAYLSHRPWQLGAHAFRERLALSLLVVLTRRYLKGERPPRQSELATELHLPLSIVEEQVEQLVSQGFLGRLAEPEGVSLLKPPELVSVKEILDATRAGGRDAVRLLSDPSDRVNDVLRRRDEAVKQSLAGLTLQSLVLGQGDTRTVEHKAA